MTCYPERFQIHSRNEIASVLRCMQERAERLRMRFSDSAEMTITRVLDVDLKNGRVFLDCAPSPVQNRIVLQSRGINFEAMTGRVRIAFRATRIRQAFYNGRAALVMALPELIVRCQHRKHVRYAVEGVFIRIPAGSKGEGAVTAVVRDISMDGITMMDEAGAIGYGVNALYQACMLFLPDMPPVMVNIRLRNIMAVTGGDALSARRIGCQFVDLADGGEAAKIRRFIANAEREIRMKADVPDC